VFNAITGKIVHKMANLPTHSEIRPTINCFKFKPYKGGVGGATRDYIVGVTTEG
jgi:hypothetical protein